MGDAANGSSRAGCCDCQGIRAWQTDWTSAAVSGQEYKVAVVQQAADADANRLMYLFRRFHYSVLLMWSQELCM